MAIDVADLIFEVRNNLGDIPMDALSDVLVYKSLQDAYDYIDMIVDITTANERHLRRCLIRLGAYNTYVNYTAIADTKLGTMPESAGLQISELLRKSYQCLKILNDLVQPDLSLAEPIYGSPVVTALSTSNIEY